MPTWEEQQWKGKRESGMDLNALAKERDRLKKEGGDENRLNAIQNQINEISGSDVRRDVAEGQGGSMGEFYTDYNQQDDPFAGGGEGATAEDVHAYNKGEGAEAYAAAGEGAGPTEEEAAPLSRRELRQEGRRDRKQTRMDNLQRKIANRTGSTGSEDDLKQARLSRRFKRLEGRKEGVGEGARKFRDRRDKVMGAMRDSKVGRFFKGNTSDA